MFPMEIAINREKHAVMAWCGFPSRLAKSMYSPKESSFLTPQKYSCWNLEDGLHLSTSAQHTAPRLLKCSIPKILHMSKWWHTCAIHWRPQFLMKLAILWPVPQAILRPKCCSVMDQHSSHTSLSPKPLEWAVPIKLLLEDAFRVWFSWKILRWMESS